MQTPDYMQIIISGDHAGFALKQQLILFLQQDGYQLTDLGPHSEESVDYPDYVHPLAQAVQNGEPPVGILICGSANGVAMTANKYKGVRAAIAWEEEIARLARQHNNANILCLPARFISEEKAKAIAKVFLETAFEGGRHARRVEKIDG